jgi:hypothetical protein
MEVRDGEERFASSPAGLQLKQQQQLKSRWNKRPANPANEKRERERKMREA